MNITVSRDDEHVTNATVASLEDVPEVLFAAANWYGAGEYIARATSDSQSGDYEPGDPIFMLATAWFEPGEHVQSFYRKDQA